MWSERGFLFDVLRIFAACALPGLSAAPVDAQPSGPAPRPHQPPPPETVDNYAWMDAYTAFGEPPVVVLAGFPGRDFSDGVLETTFRGFPYQLRVALEEYLNAPEVDLDLIDSDSLAAATKRLAGVLDNADETEAIELLANELQADLVLFVKFLDHDPREHPGATANLTFEAISMSRGRKIVSFPFEWKLGTDNRSIKRTANALAVKFTKGFAARANRSQRFDVRVIGLTREPRAVRDFRELLEGLAGTDGDVRSPRFGTFEDPLTGRSESMATFRGMKYRGDNMDLAADVADVAEAFDAIEVEFVGTETNQVTLRVVEPEETGVAAGDASESYVDCQQMILRRDTVGEEARERLRELYQRKNSPRISVLVNRGPTRAERTAANRESPGVKGETVVVVQTGEQNVAAGSSASGSGEARGHDDSDIRAISWLENQTFQVEQALFDRLGPEFLGFTRIAPDVAKTELAETAERQETVFGEREIVDILRSKNVADILILGKGGWFPEPGGDVYSATYTFRVVSLSDSVYLAGASVRGKLDEDTSTKVISEMADEAIKQIACELIQSWLPPTELATTVKGARDSRDMEQFMRLARERAQDEGAKIKVIGSPAFEGGSNRGMFTLTLSYTCAWEDLFREIAELSDAIPEYSLSIEKMDTTGLVLNIVR